MNSKAVKSSGGRRKCIIVLGMHRSGTSALTKALADKGIGLPKNFLGANESNEAGHFEPKRIIDLNDRLLAEVNSSWDDWREFDTTRLDETILTKYKHEIRNIIAEEYEEHDLFLLKEPRICRMVELYAGIFENMEIDVTYLHVIRNPVEVARSLQARNGFDLKFGMLLWCRYVLDAEKSTRHAKRLFLSFEDLIADPDGAVERVVSALRLKSRIAKQKSVSGPVQNIRPNLRRQVAQPEELDALQGDWSEVKSLYSTARTMEANPDSRAARRKLDALSDKMLSKSNDLDEALWLELNSRQHKFLKTNDRIVETNEQAQQLSKQLTAAQKRHEEAEAKLSECVEQILEIEARERRLSCEVEELLGHKKNAAELAEQLAASEKHAGNIDALLEETRQELNLVNQNLEHTITEFRSSTSWRITSPLRVFSNYSRLYLRRAVEGLEKYPGLKRLLDGARLALREIHTPADVGKAARRLYSDFKDGGVGKLDSEIANRLARQDDYQSWVRKYDVISARDRLSMKSIVDQWQDPPLISIVMPTFNSPINFLREAIQSVLDQTYENWELCIADDASSDVKVRKILEEYCERDKRIKVVYREENGHISVASNSAIDISTGEWIALLDHDDLLAPHALFCVADAIIKNPDIRLIYSDEDKIDKQGNRGDPYFKCDWNPLLFRGHNLVTHLGVYNAQMMKEIGGFREGYEGAQDYDLALRFSEKLTETQICHIPHILYHWRIIPGSTAQSVDEKPYARIAGKKAVDAHLKRSGIAATSEFLPCGIRVDYELQEKPPLVSIIIPTRNGLELTRKCIESLVSKTDYRNYEILLIDNNSDDPDALQYFGELEENGTVRLIRDERPFNYSALNNSAAKLAKGSILCLLNNDIEIISSDWLKRMVSLSMLPQTGAVGAKLLYPDDTVQHGGVIVGIGGVAGHAHLGLARHEYGYFSRASLEQNLTAVTAACLVVSKANFEAVGGLNESDLTVAFNDIDFCLKLHKAGYRNVWTPFAELYHHESATRGYEDNPEKQARFAKEIEYMQGKWIEYIEHDPAYNPNLTLNGNVFDLSFPPRVSKPWLRQPIPDSAVET